MNDTLRNLNRFNNGAIIVFDEFRTKAGYSLSNQEFSLKALADLYNFGEKFQDIADNHVVQEYLLLQKNETPDYVTDPNIFSDNEHRFIRDQLIRLPDLQFKVIYLRFWKRFNAIEIAEILNTTVRAVFAHLDQAMVTLKTYYLNEYACWSNPNLSTIRSN